MAGHEYIIGADCAEGVGRDGDNSCFEIIDAGESGSRSPNFSSNLVPPNVFAQMINQIGIYYSTAKTVVVENNSVGGAVLNSSQRNDMGYEAVYDESKKSSTKPRHKDLPSRAAIFLEAMQNRLMNGTVRTNSHRLVNELKTFIYSPQKKRAEAIKGKHDDAIMALCLALYVRDERIRGLPLDIEHAEQSIIAKNASHERHQKGNTRRRSLRLV
jgi:hypothetical protein